MAKTNPISIGRVCYSACFATLLRAVVFPRTIFQPLVSEQDSVASAVTTITACHSFSEINELWTWRLHYYGSMKPIKEQVVLSSASRSFPIPILSGIKGAIGVSYLWKDLKIPQRLLGKVVDDIPQSRPSYFDRLVALEGILAKLSGSPTYVAGSSSILLTTGRKQVLGQLGEAFNGETDLSTNSASINCITIQEHLPLPFNWALQRLATVVPI